MSKSRNFRLTLVLLYDYCSFFVASILSCLLLNRELDTFASQIEKFYWYFLILSAVHILIYIIFKIYRISLKYASVHEAVIIGLSSAIVFAINFITIISARWSGKDLLSISWACCYTIISGFFTCILRFGYRILTSNTKQKLSGDAFKRKKRVLLVGAGEAGIIIAREMINNNNLDVYPICFVDDDESKVGHRIIGIKVLGGIDSIPDICDNENIDEIFITIASASREAMNRIINKCKETRCKVKVIPGMGQIIDGKVSLGQIRDVEIGDLLGREEIKVNLDEILGYIENKTVMVTGGGGSIGSELCRQIATHKPKLLIILDIYENNAYQIEQELTMNLPDVKIIALIASVRDRNKIDDVFNKYRPNVVFHAAAHKHVPLMETSPNEAIKNNVFGTLNCVEMSDKYNVEKFILISTDKAVNPTNVMGASKRICEMIVQSYARKSETDFVAVRFGNVLGSNGSVIPLFKKQIENGGPVTVTHKDIIRYFMTIPEAVSLVLQAGAYAHGGEIFVLDMGEPVKIYDLAYNLIKLSGFEPDVDIKIKITGLRPGEKMYEEMLMAEEGLTNTKNKLIHIGKPIEMDDELFYNQLSNLYKEAYDENCDMRKYISEIVSTYKYNKE